MSGVFRPYTFVDVFGTIVGQQQSVDTSETTTGGFAEDDEVAVVTEAVSATLAPEWTLQTNGSVFFYAQINGAAHWTWSAEFFTTGESPYAPFQPNGGEENTSSYYASDRVTLVDNSDNYTSNGNAQSVTLNQWTSKGWSYDGGPNVIWLKIQVSNNASYTTGPLSVRSPSIVTTGGNLIVPSLTFTSGNVQYLNGEAWDQGVWGGGAWQ